MIAGPGVALDTDLSAIDINVMDTAATVLWTLNIEIPDDMTGRVVTEAFTDRLE